LSGLLAAVGFRASPTTPAPSQTYFASSATAAGTGTTGDLSGDNTAANPKVMDDNYNSRLATPRIPGILLRLAPFSDN
jgi:hypothetical protein